ncbi:MAG: twin-arginine translocation signal domain-containing protein [Acidobacteriota bacterium]
MSKYDSKQNPSTQDVHGDTAGLDRRGFLKISSVAAATAAVAGTSLAADRSDRPAKVQPKPRPAGAVQDYKGGWFVV